MLHYGVLASLAGHDHYYERGHEGCIDYLVLGGGGAPMYDPDQSAPGVAMAAKAVSYMVVTVRADGGASMVVKDVHGAVIDTFNFLVPDPACGSASDAGPADAGSAGDGGNAGDAGNAGDGGKTADGGNAQDAGSVADAGAAEDAGNTADGGAGSTADAGNAGDGGSGSVNGSGGCSSGGDALLGVAGVLLALGVRSRRRSLRLPGSPR